MAACAIDSLWDASRESVLDAGLVRIVKIDESTWGVSGGSLAARSGNGTGDARLWIRDRESPAWIASLHGEMGQKFDSLDVHESRSRFWGQVHAAINLLDRETEVNTF